MRIFQSARLTRRRTGDMSAARPFAAAFVAVLLGVALLFTAADRAAAQKQLPNPNEGRGGSSGASADFEPTPPMPRLGSGTGFYVNATDLVTNAHVVEFCASMRDPQGRRLSLVRIDHQLDLALLRADRQNDEWLQVAAPEPLRLGAGVYLMGFPLYGELGNSVIVTRGVVSSRSGYLGRRANFGHTAPTQPGNSGGPVLDSNGRVIGVAVARVSRLYRNPDVAPQNVNFAIGARALSDFLSGAGAEFEVARDPVADLRDGVPLDFEKTVSAVLCD